MRRILWLAALATLFLFQGALAGTIDGKWSGTLTVDGVKYAASVRFSGGRSFSATANHFTVTGKYSLSGNSVKLKAMGFNVTLKLKENSNKQVLSGSASELGKDGKLTLSRKAPSTSAAASGTGLDAAGAWTLEADGRLCTLKLYGAGFAFWSEGPAGGEADALLYATLRAEDGVMILTPLDESGGLLAAPGLASWWVEGAAGYEIPYALSQGTLTLTGGPSFTSNGESLDEKPAEAPFRPYLNLRQGDRGEAVAWLQQRLIDLNYLSGEADGIFGAQTKEALTRFQSAGALDADGIAGRDVMARLEP